MALASLRILWLRIHRWTGLTLGPLLGITALLGAMLVVAAPLDRLAHPALFTARSAQTTAALPLEPLRQRLVTEFGPQARFTLRPPHQPGETYWVLVRGPWDGTLYLDPATGAEQGRRGTHEGAYNLLFELHSSLLLDDTGKAVLAIAAIAYLLLLATGLVLWWPRRWPPSLRITLDRGLLRGLFDLHRTGGALLGLLIAVSVFTGAYMAWRPLGGFISSALGQPTFKPPAVPKGAPGGPRLSLDALVARAQQVFPGQPIGYVQVPSEPNRAMRVRFRLDDDPHPNGIGSVWLHPLSGDVLATRRWQDLDSGNGMVAVVYPLHTGVLGGPWHQVATALIGLALSGLGLSGVWLWWRRRAGALAARPDAPPRPSPR
ncbi:PepSY-associated TM helix domain-containing protein [Variovorax arabinosiphilus]|uniref:PepSY-associated TM helix domain-containing protein n=1 Tax=Variovorax arabinosiphilus TaxID=3053498 RepID=UPI002577EC97|nr:MULTISPECIES: PepSY-associated TM helix domain-containing protein [unclassified Variovorax]MDM0121793.1 PepSY-associated TM helix domain-containing protein [Variovorax sp. J2L1-78]MDM0130854.1 PepSY-associated TM helix domain-containing protein [Variovorax sp. J2L1-63]MDM0234556.1 PepSY-associated TM helix domain-containing protein [Variovorax sp. J2R1-6]